MTDENMGFGESSDGERYHFVRSELPEEKVMNVASDKLLAALSSVCSDVTRGVDKKPFDEVQGQFIALNMALNVQSKIAPRFRPSLSAGKAQGQIRTRQQNLISNDLQVLDLHWLWCRKAFDFDRLQNLPSRWRSIFGKKFDYEAASYFAGTAGEMQTKADEILCLKPSEDVELRMLQNSQTASWWNRVQKQRPEVWSLIQRAMAKSSKLEGKEAVHYYVWLAEKCKNRAGGTMPGWVELISGKKPPGTTISGIKSRVDRIMGAAKKKTNDATIL